MDGDMSDTIIELLTPALPILPEQNAAVYSLYRNLQPLPDFRQEEEEEFELQLESIEASSTFSHFAYTVYSRQTLEKYNFATRERQYSQTLPVVDKGEQTLRFESNFESGNLRRAEKVMKKQCYLLYLQNDINTSGYTQWFFFAVEGGIANKNYKFSVVNCYRDASLYEQGMKILIYSRKGHELNHKGWFRGGERIKYFNQKRTVDLEYGMARSLYTLSFNYTFEFDDDKVYFAYNYPYTLTDLHNDLEDMQCQYLKRSILCRTLAENRVEMVTITNKQSKKHKSGIIMTSRVHPSETVASYVIKGVMRFLTSQHEIAVQLRDNFIFKIVPMVNPDGVIHGNSRTNLSGRDLNRIWINPDKKLHSEIYYLKKSIIDFSKRCPIEMYCDFHGHSKKKNAFLYGCSDSEVPFKGREFPFLYSKILDTIFYQNCSFHIKKDKAGTARAVLWKSLKTHNIFTLETSTCGPSLKNIHFSYKHFEEIGTMFCLTLLLHLCDNESNRELIRDMSGILFNKHKLIKELYSKKALLTTEASSSESDNSVEDCYDPADPGYSEEKLFKKISFRSHTKQKTQVPFKAEEKEKEKSISVKKSRGNLSLQTKRAQKSLQNLVSINSIIKPKLFCMEEYPDSSPQKSKEKDRYLSGVFKPRQGASSFFCKPAKTKTIEPMVDYYHPKNRKNISSMEWTVGNTTQIGSTVDREQKQLLLKSRRSFFNKQQTKTKWKNSTISWKE